MTIQTAHKQNVTLKRQDFVSEQEVRWCPGCGDYAILATMQKTLPGLGIPKEDIVFVSGIGCSSRFPYYLSTYGFHTIHGRAPTIATGLKLANPNLSVFVITGDGDGLSIGANHLLHLIRRNVDVTVLLFNNRIYGLTKGQYSPTSETGKKTKSSPKGSVEKPVCPISFALGADASFIARAIDVDAKGLQSVIEQAVAHKGTSFVEIYQNCNVFNDGAFEDFATRNIRADQTLFLSPGEPMIFGTNQDKGLCFEHGELKVTSADAATTHQGDVCPSLIWQLAKAPRPDFPVITGILRQVERPVYDLQMNEKLSPVEASEMMSEDSWQIR